MDAAHKPKADITALVNSLAEHIASHLDDPDAIPDQEQLSAMLLAAPDQLDDPRVRPACSLPPPPLTAPPMAWHGTS